MGSKKKKESRRAESLIQQREFCGGLLSEMINYAGVTSASEEKIPTIVYLLEPTPKAQKLVTHAKELLEKGVSGDSVKLTVACRQENEDMRVRVSVGLDELARILVDDFPDEDAYDDDCKADSGKLLYLEVRLWKDY